MTKRIKGFTLIELLVVIVIIGILATLATVTLSSARGKARDARRVSDIKQIQTALELYYSDSQTYPNAITAGSALLRSDASLTATYMAKVPSNASPATDGACASINNTSYIYIPNGGGVASHDSYYIVYCLGSATGSINAGSLTASPAGLAP